MSLLVLQVPWYLAVQSYANKNYVKTKAEVISLSYGGATCTNTGFPGGRRGLSEKPCIAPTFKYQSLDGRQYTKQDKYTSNYDESSLSGRIFGKHPGDIVDAYYPKNDPQNVIFMGMPVAYTAWLIPLYLVLFIIFLILMSLVVVLISRGLSYLNLITFKK